jgi:hypothetical protein
MSRMTINPRPFLDSMTSSPNDTRLASRLVSRQHEHRKELMMSGELEYGHGADPSSCRMQVPPYAVICRVSDSIQPDAAPSDLRQD